MNNNKDICAALAAEPVFAASEPSDEDLADLSEVFNGDPLPAMRRALELWGRPTIAALAADGEREELAMWLERDARDMIELACEMEESKQRYKTYNKAIRLNRAAALLRQPAPAPVPAADGAARLRQCPTHGQQPANAWACPECLRELREELARLKAPAADGEREELAQWFDEEAKRCAAQFHDRITRATALLRQPVPAPVPVAERPWERPGWCDVEGRCWWFNRAGIPEWQLADGGPYGDFCLPHWAIPQPPQGGEVEE